jgi:hypothetical protein
MQPAQHIYYISFACLEKNRMKVSRFNFYVCFRAIYLNSPTFVIFNYSNCTA